MRRALPIALMLLAASATEARAEYYPPLDAYVAVDDLPPDLVHTTGSATSIAKRIRVAEFHYSETKSETDPEKDIGATMDLQVVVKDGFDLTVPGLEDVFALSFGASNYRALVALREEESSNPAKNYPFLGTFSATPFPIELKLKSDFFVPMKKSGTSPNFTYERYGPTETPPVPAIVPKTGVTVIVKYTWDGELDVEFDGGGGAVEFMLSTPIMLADSGVVIDAESITVDLSESGPSTDADPSWKGVRFGSFRVAFTNGIDLPDAEVAGGTPATPQWAGVSFTNFEIGTGGFSGRMCGTGLGAAMGSIDLFDMEFEPSDVCVELKRNSLVGSEIKGVLKNFPFFEEDIALTLAFDLEGNFTVGIADPDPTDADPFIKWNIPNVLDFYVDSLAFEHREGIFLVRLNGQIEPLFFSGDVQSDGPTRIAVNGLTITSEGDVSLEGGWVTLPEKRYIDFHAFQIGIAQVGFGKNKDTDGKSWVGFTGGIKLVEGLDAEAEVKKLQFLWDSSFNVSVKLEGISVAFHKEGVIDFEGSVDWFDTGGSSGTPGAKGFAGKLDVGLPAINLTVGGRVVIGKADRPSGGDFAFFYIDLETQFPTGVPIFSGISLYGLSGLFALNMSPNLTAFTSPVQWFNCYRNATNIVVGSSSAPCTDPDATWKVQDGALAFGAGVILGTADNGFSVNGKLALTIAIPGPIVMIQGQANVLKERTSLSNPAETPLFVALAVYDGNAGTFILNIGVFYELANVVKVSGEAEAFFDLNDPGNWHVWLGKKDPESARITATALGFLTASTYYMIEPTSFAYGSKASFGKSWKFGPLKVVLEAWFAWDATVNRRPLHVWGAIDVGGKAELKAFGVGVGVHVHATLELETPKPFRVEGDFKVKLSLPWPLPDPKATVHLKWEAPGTKAPVAEVVASMTLHSRKDALVLKPARHDDSSNGSPGTPSASVSTLCSPGSSLPAVGALEVDVSGGTGSTSSCGVPMVPLDTFASVKFERSMNDEGNVGLGNGYDPDLPPHVDRLDSVSYEYDATSVELLMGAKTGTLPVTVSTPPADVHGSWTSIPADVTTETHDNLDVLSKNPFHIYDTATTLGYTGESWTDWAISHYGDAYCFEGKDGIVGGHTQPPGHTTTSTHGPGMRCPGLEWIDSEDFVLPPYSAFRLVVDGRVREPGDPATTVYRSYRNTVYFHTEGPPLDLMPYVSQTVPELSWKPHYRSYDVVVRFDESYMNKLYRTAVDQFLNVELLDESENPLPGTVTTSWSEAQDTSMTPSEEAWYGVLLAHGAITSIPKDDLLEARASIADALRPGVKHRARLVLEDPRLASDARLLDATWMQRNAPRWVSADRKRVVVGEVDLLASRFSSVAALAEAWRGRWFRLAAAEPATLAQIASAAAPAKGAFLDGSAAVAPSDSGAIGRWMRDLMSPRLPADLAPDARRAWMLRTPGFSPLPIDDVQRAAADAAWSAASEAFDEIDALLGLELSRDPLPEAPEVLVLETTTGTRAGFLLELPEAIDLSRVEIEITPPSGPAYRPVVVANADSTRVFLFQPAGTSIAALVDGVHEVRLEFHRTLGTKNPVFPHRDAATDEGRLSIDVPGGELVP